MATREPEVAELLDWSRTVLGPVQLLSDAGREHPGRRTGALHLRSAAGDCFVKIHREEAGWAREVHGYRAWAAAFAGAAPELLAVRDTPPLALLISRLPGRILDEVPLSDSQATAVWRRAGEALAGLHAWAQGDFFGWCRADGRPGDGAWAGDASGFMERELREWLARGLRIDCLRPAEIGLVARARALLPAFAGEPALPCHRDYSPANWLVDDSGRWCGVIDFEFSRWDVRATDFTRYPNWEWLLRPALTDAFDEGYGHRLSDADKAQRLVGHIHYALAAVVWGMENDYFGFAAEGRQALAHLADTL